MNKSGFIQESELKFYLKHWGFETNEAMFRNLYSKLDVDGDGHISYEDFQRSAG